MCHSSLDEVHNHLGLKCLLSCRTWLLECTQSEETNICEALYSPWNDEGKNNLRFYDLLEEII